MLRFFVILDPLDKNERIYSDFYALFKPILAIIVGGLNRSYWVGMLRFQQQNESYNKLIYIMPTKEIIYSVSSNTFTINKIR